MSVLLKHWRRVAVTLLPLVFALMHATGVWRLGMVDRLDAILYDARLQAVMPRTLDDRIVIVDIDEKSLAEVGRWPWGRNKVADLVDQLFDVHQVALLGIDVVFAEADDSSGLMRLKSLAQNELRDQPGFAAQVSQLQGVLDYDALFARSLASRPVVLGYYFTGDRDGRTSGQLPAPAMKAEALKGSPVPVTSWSGYGANVPQIAQAAPQAGFFNVLPSESDGLVRTAPMLGEYQRQYYESLSLAMFRLLAGSPAVVPEFPDERWVSKSYGKLTALSLQREGRSLSIPVNEQVAVLVPFRGPGGVHGGSFRYVSAADVLAKKVPAGSLAGKIILLGTTAPGLLDLRATPVGEAYPGVEVHANVISGLLDGKLLSAPDYALGFEVLTLLVSGILLAFALPLLSAPLAVLLSVGVMGLLVGANVGFFLYEGLVLPLASTVCAAMAAFVLNMSYGYFVESRSKRALAHLFGSYVAPELVTEMVKDPGSYSMQATNKQLTVLFCDVRGFTQISEGMEPLQLQQFLNEIFSRLTDIIRANRGTIDKYMGDCVMAFWGAPLDQPDHASLAVNAALTMADAVRAINEEYRQRGMPAIGVGMGLNSGLMCVGDMGSVTRRSYTVIGDAVNLGSRLEGLSKVYGVDIVASEAVQAQVPELVWQMLDTVRVKGKQQAVTIYTPRAPKAARPSSLTSELALWERFLAAYQAQDWEQCELHLLNIRQINPHNSLYHLYHDRVATLRRLPPEPLWDGATTFDSK